MLILVKGDESSLYFASTSPNQKYTVVIANDVSLEGETNEDNQVLLLKSRKLSSGKIISTTFLSQKMRLKPSGLLYAGVIVCKLYIRRGVSRIKDGVVAKTNSSRS
nr:hypothetical protein [Tanacetum cinerariifolium]